MSDLLMDKPIDAEHGKSEKSEKSFLPKYQKRFINPSFGKV
jgi:hypothetical protein